MSYFAVSSRKRKAPGTNNPLSSSSVTRRNPPPCEESKSFSRDSGKHYKGEAAGENKSLESGRGTEWTAANLKARKQRGKGGKRHSHKAKGGLCKKARSDFDTSQNSKTERRFTATKKKDSQGRRKENCSVPFIRAQQEIDKRLLEDFDEHLPAQQNPYNLVTPIIPVMVPMEIRMVVPVFYAPVMMLPGAFSSADNERSVDSKDDTGTKTCG